MNTIGKILLYVGGTVLLYSLAVTFIHIPLVGGGSLFFLLLLACPLMMMFMMRGHSHEGHDEKKAENMHSH